MAKEKERGDKRECQQWGKRQKGKKRGRGEVEGEERRGTEAKRGTTPYFKRTVNVILSFGSASLTTLQPFGACVCVSVVRSADKW